MLARSAQLERARESDHVFFLLRRQLDAERDVKEFNRVFKREQPAMKNATKIALTLLLSIA